MSESVKPVPYVSQIDNAPAKNDCGAACVLMLSKWIGTDAGWTVDKLAASIGKLGKLTGKADIEAMLRNVKLTPTSGMALSYPYVALVRYKDLPSRYSTSFDYDSAGNPVLHWVVRLDELTYHDPLYPGTRGANKVITPAQWARAEVGISYRTGITQRPQEAQMAEPARVKYDRVYHVINAGATEDEAVAIFRAAFKNNRQTVGFSYDDAGIGDGLQSKRAILHGIKDADRAAFINFYRQYYPSVTVEFAGETKPPVVVTPPTPQPQPQGVTFAKHLGVSALIDAAAGMDALARGCRSVLFLNNTLAAIQAAQKYPDAITFMRVWWGTKLMPHQMADALVGGAKDIPRNCYTTILNECDTWCYGSPEEIRERFNVEKQVCENIWRADPNRILCIGAFSHGTPDITRQDIRDAWRATYGQFAIDNKHRIRLNWHLYTKGRRFLSHPPADAPIYEPKWFEGRDNEFWTQTGMPQDVRCTSDETFVEAGHGGGKWAGYTAQQLIEWAWWWRDYKESNFVRHDACLIFQFGDHPGWQGYDMRYLVETLTGLWQGKIGRPVMPRNAEPIFYDEPPAYEVPPAKDLGKGLEQ